MGLADLFKRKKTNYFKNSIEPQCAYCQYGKRTKDGNRILCEKRGLMEEDASCKNFIYSPLKRIPVKQLNIEGAVTADEMYVEISEEELAAKQAAAAKADAAEKAHAMAVAKAKAEEEAKAQAEAAAKAEAEAKAQAEAAARAEEEAKAQAEAAARAQAEEASKQSQAEREIAEAAAAAEAVLRMQTPAPKAAPARNDELAQAAQAAAKALENARNDLDDEFADLDTLDGADVVVAAEREVMHSKKHRLAEENAVISEGDRPKLPPASAFINKK